MEETTEGKTIPRKLLFAFIAFDVLFTLMIGAGIWVWFSLEESTGQAARTGIERLYGAPLPDQAANIHFLYWGGITGWRGHASFDAAPEEIQSWLEEGVQGLTPVLEPTAPLPRPFPNQEWWQPEAAQRASGDAVRKPSATGDETRYGILIDQSRDERWIVYLYAKGA